MLLLSQSLLSVGVGIAGKLRGTRTALSVHRRNSAAVDLPDGHRYFFYVAFVIASINSYDAIVAFHSPSGFGFGLGNIVLVANVLLLWAYTGGCHSCRHLIGGRLNHFSRHPARYWLWTKVTWFNERHMQFAWITLGTLALTDFYVMLVASGAISDPRFVG